MVMRLNNFAATIFALSLCYYPTVFGWMLVAPQHAAFSSRPSSSSSSSSSSCKQLLVDYSNFDFSLSATQPQRPEASQQRPEDSDEDEEWLYDDFEVLQENEEDDDEEDWIPDSVMAQGRKTAKHLRPAKEVIKSLPEDDINSAGATTETKKVPSPYTEEEEAVIAAMGGKKKGVSRREDGYLGDSTLAELATDYSVPICYLADVLATWGIPVPINVHDRLGDLATGEQAFALLEALNSLDIGALQDRYSNSNIMQLCADWEIDLKDAFEFAMKEGWNLPFGVRTNLRVEQESELLRQFSQLYSGE